jgi:L-2-hydroxycarboxylate dehydrogenase (NAD+)
MPGQERIYTAGEKEHLAWLEREKSGVPISHAVQQEMIIMRDELGLSDFKFPF